MRHAASPGHRHASRETQARSASTPALEATDASIKARDGTEIFLKDWGGGRPVILIHGYPLNADSFDRTALKLAEAGYRAINYDRRGFGRSDQPWKDFDWDTYADDLADVMQATGATEDATVIGYSMGGGECARYISRHGGSQRGRTMP